MEEEKKTLSDMVQAPRKIDIDGQLHMLAWITADEGKALKLLGGAGTPGPMGIPAYYGNEGTSDQESDNAEAAAGVSDAEGDTSGTYGGPNNDGPSSVAGLDSSLSDMQDVQAGLEGKGPADIGGNENDPIKKAIQEVAEKIPDESPLTDAMKAYYGKGIGTSTIDMSTAAGRATSLANMTSPSTSAIGGKFDPATGRYIFPDGRIFDTATGKFLPISQSNKIEGLDLFRPLEGVK